MYATADGVGVVVVNGQITRGERKESDEEDKQRKIVREGMFIASWRLYLLKGRILTERFSYAEKRI